MKYDPPTDEEMEEIGKRIYADPSSAVTNIEMEAGIRYSRKLKRERQEREGCCGDKPIQGWCYVCAMKCPPEPHHEDLLLHEEEQHDRQEIANADQCEERDDGNQAHSVGAASSP